MSLPADPATGDVAGTVAHSRRPSRPASIGSLIDHVLVGDYEIGQGSRRYASLAALVAAMVIGSLTYVREGWVFDREVSLLPDLVSGIAAVFLVGALYARRVVPLAGNFYSLASLVLNCFVTANFVQAVLGGGWSVAGLGMPWLVLFAIILTWVGMRALAPVAWLLVIVLGFINLQMVSQAMGLWGFVFIILAMLGFLLQIGASMKAFMPELRQDFAGPPVGVRNERA